MSAALSKWERAGLWALLAVVLVFGAVVEMRSAFLKRRMTDADVYFRAAWAVRSGADLYEITDTNGWHYNYPPLLAVLMTPLANPPPGAGRAGMLPYPVSVAIWYAVSVAALAGAIHGLASAVEGRLKDPPPRGSRRWWALRIVPALLCLMAIGRTLSRGQVNMLVLLCLCGMAALVLCRRPMLAGACLAGAICLKVFPAFMLLYLVARREWLALVGCAMGLIAGLVFIPVAGLGWDRTVEAYRDFDRAILRPGLSLATDKVRAEELTNATATRSQSFMSVLHNCLHPHRATRPDQIAPSVRAAHWIIGVVVTGITLAAGWKTRRGDPIAELIFLGALMTIMLPISPVCHVHYFVFTLPLVMGLVSDAWERHAFPRLGSGCVLLFVLTIAGNLVTSLPGLEHSLKDFGVTLYATLALWAAGLVALFRRADWGNAAPSYGNTTHTSAMRFFAGSRSPNRSELPMPTG